MGTYVRKNLPKHHLFVDTSVLWCDDKSVVVNPKFEDFWVTYSQNCELLLRVPQVVRGELLFQQTKSALNALRKANEEIDKVSATTGKKYSHRIAETRIRKEVEERIDKWLVQKSASVDATPVEKIDWKKLIHSAIWRLPPFVIQDKRGSESEKGFRDSLVAETFLATCNEIDPCDRVSFITGDSLLFNTVQSHIKNISYCSAYRTIDDFASYLRLSQETLTDDFVRAIQTKASEKFFKPRDLNSLIFKEQIISQIRHTYSEKFKIPDDPLFPHKGLWTLGSRSGGIWKSIDEERVWVSNAHFEKLEEHQKFFWQNTVTFKQKFKWAGEINIFNPAAADEEHTQTLKFVIHWRANIGSTGRFDKIAITNIEFLDRHFQVDKGEVIVAKLSEKAA